MLRPRTFTANSTGCAPRCKQRVPSVADEDDGSISVRGMGVEHIGDLGCTSRSCCPN